MRQSCLALLWLPSLAVAQVSENLRYQHYPVLYLPNRSLMELVELASPIVRHGRVFHGDVRWDIQWQYDWYREPDGRCRITHVRTRLNVIVRMPELEGGTSRANAEFGPYYQKLLNHEHGHVHVGRITAKRIDQ